MSISNSFLDPPICALHVPLEDNYPGVCDGRSVWMIDCRKLDDPEHDVKPGIHVGRNPRIMRSILGSKDYHELHSRLYEGISRFLSIKNVVIMICESGRHRSVANSELWSSTLSRYGRFLHSVSLIHLSEHDFWKDTCAGKCSECNKQSTKTFHIHYDCVRAECSRLAPATDPVTEHWKRPRRGSFRRSREGSKSL